MPETVFIKDGKFDSMVMCDKDFCLTFESNKLKMMNLKVRMKLVQAVRERKADSVSLGLHRLISRRHQVRDNVGQFLKSQVQKQCKYLSTANSWLKCNYISKGRVPVPTVRKLLVLFLAKNSTQNLEPTAHFSSWSITTATTRIKDQTVCPLLELSTNQKY